jgi:EmrB/QacA subfamily drug resistance transporter
MTQNPDAASVAGDVTGSPDAYVQGARRAWIIAGLLLAMILAALDQTVVSTALPVIASGFDGLAQMTWVVTAFMLTSTVSAPLYGKLSDMYGRKPLFAASVGIFLVASALCGSAQSMTQVIVYRGLQGLGAGGLMTLSQTVIGDIVSPRDRARYQGLFTGAFAASSAAGPVLGGFLTSHFSWRWVFYVNLPIGLVSLALALLTLPPGKRAKRHRIDYVGAALLVCGASAALLVMDAGNGGFGLGSAHGVLPMLALGVIAVACFASLAVVERRVEEPMVSFGLLRIAPYATCVAASGMMTFAMMGSLVFMPLYFQLVLHQTPEQSGLMLLPQVAMMLISSFVGGRFATSDRRLVGLLAFGVALECAGLATLAVLAHLGADAPFFLIAMAMLGSGMGIAMPNATVIVQNSVPSHAIGEATASMSFVRSLGGALGIGLSGGVMSASLRARLSGLPASLDPRALIEQGAPAILRLPHEQQMHVVEIYRMAIGASLIAGGCVMFVGLLLILRLARDLRTQRAG